MSAFRFPPRRILVGVDMSETSLSAWRHAEAWAGRFGSQLKAVHALCPQPLEIPSVPRVPGGAAALAEDLREEFRARVGAELEVLEGDSEITLLRIARSWKADLLIVGTHGRSGLTRILLGSVAEAIVLQSPLPVLVVHEDPNPIRSVLAPVNFTAYGDQALRYAGLVASSLDAKLVAQHVVTPGEDFGATRVRLERELEALPPGIRSGCAPRGVMSRGTPVDSIARSSGAYDLVVMSGHHKGFLRDLLVGTTAQQLLRAAKTPILVVPATESVKRDMPKEFRLAPAW